MTAREEKWVGFSPEIDAKDLEFEKAIVHEFQVEYLKLVKKQEELKLQIKELCSEFKDRGLRVAQVKKSINAAIRKAKAKPEDLAAADMLSDWMQEDEVVQSMIEEVAEIAALGAVKVRKKAVEEDGHITWGKQKLITFNEQVISGEIPLQYPPDTIHGQHELRSKHLGIPFEPLAPFVKEGDGALTLLREYMPIVEHYWDTLREANAAKPFPTPYLHEFAMRGEPSRWFGDTDHEDTPDVEPGIPKKWTVLDQIEADLQAAYARKAARENDPLRNHQAFMREWRKSKWYHPEDERPVNERGQRIYAKTYGMVMFENELLEKRAAEEWEANRESREKWQAEWRKKRDYWIQYNLEHDNAEEKRKVRAEKRAALEAQKKAEDEAARKAELEHWDKIDEQRRARKEAERKANPPKISDCVGTDLYGNPIDISEDVNPFGWTC